MKQTWENLPKCLSCMTAIQMLPVLLTPLSENFLYKNFQSSVRSTRHEGCVCMQALGKQGGIEGWEVQRGR